MDELIKQAIKKHNAYRKEKYESAVANRSCPTCLRRKGQPCVTKAGNLAKKPHTDRFLHSPYPTGFNQ